MSLEPSSKLTGILAELKNACAATGEGRTRWMRPGDWNGDATDLENMAEAFSRKESGVAYSEALTSGEGKAENTMASCMARMTEMAYLGAMERAFFMRHLSPARAMAHATALQQAHGNPAGVHQGVVLAHVNNILKSAKASTA